MHSNEVAKIAKLVLYNFSGVKYNPGYRKYFPSEKGKFLPLVMIAARDSTNVLFPSPGSPLIIVTFPFGIYGYHSHSTLFT